MHNEYYRPKHHYTILTLSSHRILGVPEVGQLPKTIIINTGDKISLQSTKDHKKDENQLNTPNNSSGTQVIREALMTHND